MIMRKRVWKIGCLLLALLVCAAAFTGCELNLSANAGPEPVAVALKTDLHDARFTFTYGELRDIIDAETLSNLFEDYENKTDDVTVELGYYDIRARFGGDQATFDAVMALLSDEDLAALNGNRTEVLAYYTELANAIKALKMETIRSESFWVDDGTITFTDEAGNTQDDGSPISKAARLFKDMSMQGISSVLPENETIAAGTDLTDLLYLYGSDDLTALTDADLLAAYSTVNETTEKDSQENDVITELTRTIELQVRPETESVLRAINVRDEAAVLEKLNRPENSFTINGYDMQFTSLTITATFDAATDELLTLSYDRTMHITATVTGEGTLAPLGTQTVDFDCGANTYYQFGWADRATA